MSAFKFLIYFLHCTWQEILFDFNVYCREYQIINTNILNLGLASLLRRMNKEDVTISVDGSLFKHHPKYKKYMELFITELAPNNKVRKIYKLLLMSIY